MFNIAIIIMLLINIVYSIYLKNFYATLGWVCTIIKTVEMMSIRKK